MFITEARLNRCISRNYSFDWEAVFCKKTCKIDLLIYRIEKYFFFGITLLRLHKFIILMKLPMFLLDHLKQIPPPRNNLRVALFEANG